MNKRIFVFSLMFVICASNAQIYKWTDSQGIIHFSDSPHTGAETIKNEDIQGYSPPASETTTPQAGNKADTKDKAEERQYKSVSITQPRDQDTIRNNQGYVVVSAEVEPELFEGDTLQMIFDDAPMGNPQTGLMFQLNGMDRGSHTIAVQVLDAKGEVLISSEKITIFMHRPRVGMGRKQAL